MAIDQERQKSRGLRATKPNLIAPAVFGLIHGRISPFQDSSLARFLVSEQRHSDARRALITHYSIDISGMSDVENVRLRQGNP